MRRHIFLLLVLAPFFTIAQTKIEETGSEISAEDAQAVLDHHNAARAEVGVEPLTWNPEVAAFAQAWADSLAQHNDCQIKHHSSEKHYGENIFGASSAEVFKPVDASKAWLNEKEKYTYSKLGDGNWMETSHYTQMIWSTTKEMGMGVATCPSGGVVIVANYSPAGNMSGEYPYQK